MKTTFQIISELQAKYIRCIDRDLLEQWPEFFSEDCFYKVTTADNIKNKLPDNKDLVTFAIEKNQEKI